MKPFYLRGNIYIICLFQVFDILRPKLIFSGHEHKSMIVDTNKYQDYRKITKLSAQDNTIHTFQLTDGIIREVIVPTCSYRMGTNDIGYGVAVIGEYFLICYGIILWLWIKVEF